MPYHLYWVFPWVDLVPDLCSSRLPLFIGFFIFHVAFTASNIALHQAAWIHSASSSIRILCHQFSSEPPPRSEDDDLQPIDSMFIFIIGLPVMFLLDSILDLYKPTHDKASPHHCSHASLTPLQQFAGMRSGGASRSRSVSFKDLDVKGYFLKGLFTALM